MKFYTLLRQLKRNNPPIFFRLSFCCEGRIAGYVTAATKAKTDKKASKMGGLFLSSCLSIFCLFSESLKAEDFSTLVNLTKIEIINNRYELNAEIKHNLSPTAKEALQKGIPLAWNVLIKVKQTAPILDTTLKKTEINIQLLSHPLLNLYSVKVNNQVAGMYSTLTAALNALSKIQSLPLIDKKFIQPDRHYYVAIKVMFDREALPIPLRPQSYFNLQWALSSQWTSWPLPN